VRIIHPASARSLDGTILQLTLDLIPTGAAAEEAVEESLENRVRAVVNASFRRAEIHFQRRFERAQLAFNLRGMAAAVAYPARNANSHQPPLAGTKRRRLSAQYRPS